MADSLEDGTNAAMPFDADPLAEAATQLARLAGKIVLDHFERAAVSWKADDSMVADADLAVQWWLEEEIAAAFPEDGVLGEEGADHRRRRLDARHVWVLDPVDGTNNFGRGIPGFAVSVGVLRDGMPVAGAVYDPVADQLFTASAGWGGWLNGRRLRCEPAPLGGRSLFAIRSPFEGDVPPFVQSWLRRFRLRRFGSTARQRCYVAAGALAFVHDHRASLWDIAGAAPILLESGAVVTTPEGAGLFPIHPGRYRGEPIALLVGDPLAHQQDLADVAAAA